MDFIRSALLGISGGLRDTIVQGLIEIAAQDFEFQYHALHSQSSRCIGSML